MKNKIPVIITALSIVAATVGITVGVKATHEKNAARKDVQALLAKLSEKEAAVTAGTEETAEPSPVVALKDLSAIGTNDVTELQEQLAARDAELERLRAERERRGARQSFRERMARLKEEDPERYAEMVQRGTERHQQMRYNQASRLASFMDMDTSGMTKDELANHNLLLEKLSALWDATGEFDPENPPDRETMREIFGSMREIGELMDEERSFMFKQLGSEVGLNTSESEEFAAYVESIIDTTSFSGGPRMRGGPPPGGGGPGGDS